MAMQIANPVVLEKIERLAKAEGLTKTGAVEMALDAMLTKQPSGGSRDPWDQLDAILAQFDRIPDRPDPVERLEWDEHGLPR